MGSQVKAYDREPFVGWTDVFHAHSQLTPQTSAKVLKIETTDTEILKSFLVLKASQKSLSLLHGFIVHNTFWVQPAEHSSAYPVLVMTEAGVRL